MQMMKIAQTNEDIRQRNLRLWSEAHARRDGESVPLLRDIPPPLAQAAMRNNEATNGERNIRKESLRNVLELNFQLQRPVDFVQ